MSFVNVLVLIATTCGTGHHSDLPVPDLGRVEDHRDLIQLGMTQDEVEHILGQLPPQIAQQGRGGFFMYCRSRISIQYEKGRVKWVHKWPLNQP
jgi:hypothetical protein